MAGDWIKMRVDLAGDPAVITMAAALNLEDDAIVGKLHRLWSWADGQSRKGDAPGVTESWIDRHVRHEGFAAAMVKAGWLTIAPEGVTFPNFDRHNGRSGKTRSLGTMRQQKHRANADGVTDTSRAERDQTVTREQERREYINQDQKQGTHEVCAAPPARAADPIFGGGLEFLRRKGVPEQHARSILGKLRKEAGDVAIAALLADCEAKDISDPVPWLCKAATNVQSRASGAKPASARRGAVNEMEAWKDELATDGNPDGIPKTVLPEPRPDAGGGLAQGNGAGVGGSPATQPGVGPSPRHATHP